MVRRRNVLGIFLHYFPTYYMKKGHKLALKTHNEQKQEIDHSTL